MDRTGDRTDALLGRHGGRAAGAVPIITAEELDHALGACVLCGGPLHDGDDVVHSRLSDCRNGAPIAAGKGTS